MEKFLQIKEAFIELLKGKDPCKPEYRRVLESETEEQLLDVIKDNLGWCSTKQVCPDSFLQMFTPEVLLKYGIANSGEGNIGLGNTGDSNTGDSNTGDSNTGHWNTGDSNTGHWNTGHSNTGHSNTGDRNTGHWNTGHSNTGHSNTGHSNTGHWNTGDRNTGHWNTGHSNTGHSNTGDRNTGAFCTGEAPFPMFNKPSSWTEKEFVESKAFELLCNVDTKQWVPSSHMTEDEKQKFPSHATCEGYLKDIPFKDAFQNAWHNWSAESRQAFTSLPNFDSGIFFEITGVKVSEQ